jgi:hypothetical protein
MPEPTVNINDILIPELGMTYAQLEQRTESIIVQIDTLIRDQKTYAHVYPTSERALGYAHGLIHSEDEGKALNSILNAAQDHPAFLEPLSDTDGGTDSETFEVDLLRARFLASQRLQKVGRAAESLATLFLDTSAHIGEQAKPITHAAYRILKPLSAAKKTLKTALADAINFFAKPKRNSK